MNTGKKELQIAQRNNFTDLLVPDERNDFLKLWLDMYFEIEVTTLPSSRKTQIRDLTLFINYMIDEVGSDQRIKWTPRLSADFKKYLQSVINENGKRRWNDKTINRILAHIKTFSKWIHKLAPFPLGNPMEKLKSISVGNSLDVERALTKSERRNILDAADYLLISGGRSKDRSRFRDVNNRPLRKGYRPYRNRAIIYTLIETGMRRGAVTKINIHDIDFNKATITVEEKGSVQVKYNISKTGLAAIQDYVETDREPDQNHWSSPALFLTAETIRNGTGRLSAWTINKIWNDVCENLNINKSPHSARHAMGKYIMDKTGNIAAVQRQLGHKNATYSMQYARATNEELANLLNER